MRILFFALLLCFAGTGCSFFTAAEPHRTGYVSQMRWRAIRIENSFICLYDEKNTKETELAAVRLLAAELGLTVEFRSVPDLHIPSLLRSGRGDLAAGGYSDETAAERILGSISYNGYVFLRRSDDTEWERHLNVRHK